MANNEITNPIPARLKNVTGGHVAGAKDIIDDALGKEQSVINQERINDIEQLREDTQEDIQRIEDKVDEIGDAIQFDEDGDLVTVDGDDFSDPASSAKIPTIGAIKGGADTLGIVYDVSAKNPSAGPNHDGKFTLEYILNQNNVNTLIPTSVRKGGMSIKFVQSSDNKYVQARLMAQNFTTDVTQWQGVDEEPTPGSDNLVKSGGVANYVLDVEHIVGDFKVTAELTQNAKTPLMNLPNANKVTIEILEGTTCVFSADDMFYVMYQDDQTTFAMDSVVNNKVTYTCLQTKLNVPVEIGVRPNKVSQSGTLQIAVTTGIEMRLETVEETLNGTVSFEKNQSLTNGQKTTARNNIGAASQADLNNCLKKVKENLENSVQRIARDNISALDSQEAIKAIMPLCSQLINTDVSAYYVNLPELVVGKTYILKVVVNTESTIIIAEATAKAKAYRLTPYIVDERTFAAGTYYFLFTHQQDALYLSIHDVIHDVYTVVSSVAFYDVSSNDTYNTRNKIYGIEINNAQSSNNVRRIADASGLINDFVVGSSFQVNNGYNDFDNIYPWCEMKLCNVKIVNGLKVITYYGENGFTRDGSNGDVMVEIPKFYSMRRVDGNKESICISGEKKAGFEVEPVFIDANGEELNFVYCGAYLATIENNKLTSKTGLLPVTNKTLSEFRTCDNEMYDFAMVQCLQKLICIEFGIVDVQSLLGGLSWLPYTDVKAYSNESGVNSAYFYSDVLNDQNYPNIYKIDYLFVGESISIVNSVGAVENRRITALGDVIAYEEDGISRHRRLVTFTGEAVTLTKDVTHLTGHVQLSGLADNIEYHTGRAGLNVSYTAADQFKYRNIEGLWGNVGEFMDGVSLKNADYYFTFDQSKYGNLSNYTKLSYNASATPDNTHKYNWKYIVIKQMGYDRRYPNINLPISVTGYAATLPVYYGCNICTFDNENYEGQSTVDVELIGISSLAWDAGRFNGPWTMRFWITSTTPSWLYGTRMIYRSL